MRGQGAYLLRLNQGGHDSTVYHPSNRTQKRIRAVHRYPERSITAQTRNMFRNDIISRVMFALTLGENTYTYVKKLHTDSSAYMYPDTYLHTSIHPYIHTFLPAWMDGWMHAYMRTCTHARSGRAADLSSEFKVKLLLRTTVYTTWNYYVHVRTRHTVLKRLLEYSQSLKTKF